MPKYAAQIGSTLTGLRRTHAADLGNVGYYDWWIVVASMGALALAGSVYWQGFGLFFLPLAREFSIGRAALASAYSVSQVEGGLLGPVGGYLSDRFGPRRMMVIGVGVTGVGYLLLSRVDTFLGFYLVFVLVVSLGVSVGIRVPTLVVTNNWFVQKRGIALGLMSSGTGLGGVFVPGLGWLIARLGWRNAAAIVGVVVWCVGLPIATVLRRRPEEYGLRPDGRTELAAERQAAPHTVTCAGTGGGNLHPEAGAAHPVCSGRWPWPSASGSSPSAPWASTWCRTSSAPAPPPRSRRRSWGCRPRPASWGGWGSGGWRTMSRSATWRRSPWAWWVWAAWSSPT